ncbi:DUF3857 domain-containing protein [Terriglobus aquaticus]|uniref:DUF3857 domain-containing protein n=1 Tax=Terriglobus aquaticus TaxID=940139 RepID=A0ABW9KM28_9BACT|nr:DUF3857 domain-containing protein [Terriglobus aquaticus]
MLSCFSAFQVCRNLRGSRGVRALAPLALCAAVTAPAMAKDQVPDWVRQAATQPLRAYPPRTDAVVLLDDHTYTVTPDGTRVDHVRRVVKVLRPQGRKYATMAASFSNAQKLRSMHIWSMDASGHEYAPKDNELSDVSDWSGFELYSDQRARIGTPPAIDAGSIAAVEYEREERPYENEIVWIPEEDIPVLKETLTVNLPAGYTLTSAWKGKPTSQPVDLEKGRTLWQASELPALRHEHIRMAPSEFSQASRLDVFYLGPNATQYPPLRSDWKDIGIWFEALAHDRNKPDAAITAKAQELVAGKTDFRDRVEAIADYVQGNIRYVAIEIGIGGNQPHPAADIFRARYGDCKDKATLLSAMLQAVGIRSTWVMVHTDRDVVAQDAPSIIGNHMIAAIELPAGYKPREMYSVVTAKSGKRFLIFDPTWEKTPFGDVESNLQGSDALLIDGADSQAIRIPVLPPERNRVNRTEMYKLRDDGGLTGNIRESRQGDIAADYRMHFASADAARSTKYVERLAAEDLSSFQLANLKVTNDSDLSRPFLLSYDLTAPNYAQAAGPLLMVRPRVLGNESFGLDRAELGRKRSVPIDLGSTREVHDNIEIELPAGYAVDELPEPLHYNSGFASYTSKVTAEGNKLKYDRTLTVRQITLPPDRYGDVEELSRIINTDEQRTAVLKKN